jgi:two-component system phosphate regulon response regulator OmpR
VNAVLRRQPEESLPGAPLHYEQTIHFGRFELNLATRKMMDNGNEVFITSSEFSVLKSLLTHPRAPLSRDKLMHLARGRDYNALERSIDVQVSRLRRIIEENPSKPRYLQTVWGVGYVFVPD